MAEIEFTPHTLIVHITGADRLWALKSHLEIPLDHISGATLAREEVQAWLHGLRVGGTHVPGVLSAGRFYQDSGLVFWDVHDPDRAVAITLADERYTRLIIEVENPTATIDALAQAIRSPAGAR